MCCLKCVVTWNTHPHLQKERGVLLYVSSMGCSLESPGLLTRRKEEGVWETSSRWRQTERMDEPAATGLRSKPSCTYYFSYPECLAPWRKTEYVEWVLRRGVHQRRKITLHLSYTTSTLSVLSWAHLLWEKKNPTWVFKTTFITGVPCWRFVLPYTLCTRSITDYFMLDLCPVEDLNYATDSLQDIRRFTVILNET